MYICIYIYIVYIYICIYIYISAFTHTWVESSEVRLFCSLQDDKRGPYPSSSFAQIESHNRGPFQQKKINGHRLIAELICRIPTLIAEPICCKT